MIITTVKEESRYVEWDDIEGRAEQDDWSGDAPWEECDGWDHEFHRVGYYTHEGVRDSRGWVNRTTREGGSGWIEVDDETVVGWGCTGYPGCSKQVRAETIARAKRVATEQLVKWYSDGWYVSCAIAEYGDYLDSVGGIYDEAWGDHAEEMVLECRHNVADQLEDDGYEVSGRPDPPKPYNRIDAFRDRIRRNLNNA